MDLTHELVEIKEPAPKQEDLSLKVYFRIEEHETEWRYFCKKCGKGWKLAKNSVHPGNHLFLLNHGREHLKRKK